MYAWQIINCRVNTLSQCLMNVSSEQTHFSVNLSFGQQRGRSNAQTYLLFVLVPCYEIRFCFEIHMLEISLNFPQAQGLKNDTFVTVTRTVLYSLSWHNQLYCDTRNYGGMKAIILLTGHFKGVHFFALKTFSQWELMHGYDGETRNMFSGFFSRCVDPSVCHFIVYKYSGRNFLCYLLNK